MHSCVASSTAHTYKQIMKTFLPTARTSTLNTSRRHFILGSAAVAGSGLALGLPAAWSLSVDALRQKTVDAIKQTTFTRRDIEQITRGIDKAWHDLLDDDVDGENTGGRLHGAPTSTYLAYQAWRFFAAPSVTDIACDVTDLWHYMESGGRLVEWSAGLNESYLSTEAIADRVSLLWEYASKSGPIFATPQVFILVSARSDHLREGRWDYLHDYLHDYFDDLKSEWGHVYLESSIAAGETATVCLWIGEATR